MTADHTPEWLSAGSAEEREALLALLGTHPRYVAHEALRQLDRLAAHLADVEARLAAVEALADEWELDQNPHAAWLPIDFAHALRAALHPDPSERP